jgi:hypothetical protein
MLSLFAHAFHSCVFFSFLTISDPCVLLAERNARFAVSLAFSLRFTMLAGSDEAAPRSGILGPLPCTHSETPLNNNREAALHTVFADKARLRPDQVERAHQVRAAAFSQPIPASVPISRPPSLGGPLFFGGAYRKFTFCA